MPWSDLLAGSSFEIGQPVTREAEGALTVVDSEEVAEAIVLAMHEVAGRAADRAVARQREDVRNALAGPHAGRMRRTLVAVTDVAAPLQVGGEELAGGAGIAGERRG